ncbi:hypothetical protein DYB25_003008 [Aphanomyces astaci]|uniref:Uncharacterized protein n=1 Tax=Aphanomyces astaci TaxID=112090 RepID=A0A396ZUL1_APHAT|nr:hypothetical protein DYB25_003008 [Aphanomyces astaci]RHY00473.1 hypothetical protein DYB36_008053 [Aphanomyces astaci]RHY63335.1 hypothetical protein DYB38_011260 [Aphanomyces astaci]RHY70319.1 hypothetical protein DYB30_003642 [Aphanomyces astaci]RHY75766.1 hypothetical protein DYB34_011424 [Aphanomyces astaci]
MEKSVRTAYKKLIKLAQSLPADQKPTALDKIRHDFRSHGVISTAEELDKLVMKAQSKISYLKIVTPKRTPQSGPQRFIYKDGKRLDSQSLDDGGNRTIKTTDVNAMMERHVKLIRRQHFMDRK